MSKSLTATLCRNAFKSLCLLGRPIGGVRPRRIYHWLAKRGYPYPSPSWTWTRNGSQMKLCPYYLIDREIVAFGEYDPPLHRFYRRSIKPGMVCLDVGANIGDSSLHLASLVGEQGAIHAFEPAPLCRARLQEHLLRNGMDWVVVHAFGLGAEPADCVMATSDYTAENQGQGSIVNLGQAAGALVTTVRIETLDATVNRHGIERIDFIKVDIQGAEPYFLAGAKNALKRMRPLLAMEVSPDDLRCAGSDSRELTALLEDLGYRVFALEPRGAVGKQICVNNVSPDFAASNVICIPQ